MKPIWSFTFPCVARGDHLVTLPHGHRHGFFAENVFAGLRGPQDDVLVKGRGGDHHDRVDPWVGQRIPVVGVPGLHFQLALRTLQSRHMRIRQRDQPGTSGSARKVSGMNHPGPAGAYDADTHPIRIRIHVD